MLLVQTASSQDIRLETLDDGPGLLPFKLGPTKLITHHHTFLQRIQLNDIEDKISTLQTQIQTFETRLPNDTYALYELQITYLNNKLEKALTQLASLEPNRAKRGLVNAFGSIIKSITGNLDYNDALKYNDAIKTLHSNEDKLAFELNNYISYSKDWMTKHFDAISQMVENQNIINSTLNSLLDKEYLRNSSVIKYAKFAQLLTIISQNIDEICTELTNIENILAFVRASSTHHAMLKVDILGKMISRLSKLYSKENILNIELREFYEIIKPAFYYVDKEIVLVFKIPIVTKENYSLYRLSIVPNRNHQAIIPSYPYMANSESAFVYIEAECPKLSNGYLCQEGTNHQIRTVPDCIQHLILKQALTKTCKLSTVTLFKEAMEKLDDHHYIISLPHETKIQLSCKREEYTQLQGSYLVVIPLKCILRTPEFTIINDNDELKGQPLKIMNIPDLKMQSIDSTHINLHSIDLRSLHNAQNKISLQTPVKIDEQPTTILYHTTIPLYAALFGATALTIVVMLRRYGLLKLRKNEAIDTVDYHQYAKPSLPEKHNENLGKPVKSGDRKLPSTFDLQVLK